MVWGSKFAFTQGDRGVQRSVSVLVHSGKNSDSLGIVGIAIPAGLFGWEKVWVGTKIVHGKP